MSKESVIEQEGAGQRAGPLSVTVAVASDIRRTLDPLDHGERVDHHVLIVPTGGAGEHNVDFRPWRAEPGRALHVQPGQVHRWGRSADFEAIVVTVGTDLCPPSLFCVCEPCPEVALGPAARVVAAVAADLVREAGAASPDRWVMAASGVLLMHHVSRAGGETEPAIPPAQAELLRSFRNELESSFAVTRSVSEYARMIGTSTKTLSRVTSGVTGVSPKELIDRRVILEARRLLAHSTESASSIGSMLGFSEPTNFTKFFARHTGISPQEFRAGV